MPDSVIGGTVDTTDKDTPKPQSIVKQALERFRLCVAHEADNREDALDDLEMLAGNQWPKELIEKRELEGRPWHTINKLPSFVDQIVNDSRLNKVAVKILPFGGGSTEEIAEVYDGLIRQIEAESDADVVYQTALECAVNSGWGYYRIITAYSDDSSWDLDILIKRIRNPFTVYLDPYHVEHDGSDGRYGFITEMIGQEEYKARYPGKDPPVPIAEGGEAYGQWVEGDRVRVGEYWVKEPTTKRLYLLEDGRTVDGDDWDSIVDDLILQGTIHLAPSPEDPNIPVEVQGPAPEGSGYPEEVINPPPRIMRRREVKTHKVVQYFIDGEKIIDGNDEGNLWAGRYIPIIPIWGKELVINEKRHLRGAIRFAKDPQRAYNYFRTAATELVALTPKAPYMVEEKQIVNEEDWNELGTTNKPYITYKNVQGVPPPQRQMVTQTALGEITEANISDEEMKSTTSLHNPSLGQAGNEVSGRAILARQQRGDMANLTFHDNQRRGVRYGGRILVDLIPRIYDTERQLVILNEDGTEKPVTVNQVVTDAATGKKVMVNDLSMGKYKVVATTGPSFTTQRVEAAASMMDFVRTSPETAAAIMDLVAEAQDWPKAKLIAKRLKKLLEMQFPGIDEEGPMPPPEPSLDDIIKQLKSKGINLGNILKLQDIEKGSQDTEAEKFAIAQASAEGVMDGLTGGDRETQE